jgi:hypothetical protein
MTILHCCKKSHLFLNTWNWLSHYRCIFPNCSCWVGQPMISQINSLSDKWGSGDTMIYTCSTTNDSQIPASTRYLLLTKLTDMFGVNLFGHVWSCFYKIPLGHASTVVQNQIVCNSCL